ncbi:MAG: PEGA domain-containing protein [Spirochaetia bacterium]|nr:PEGA domain-containing protein [Spirochaetia bacterium]
MKSFIVPFMTLGLAFCASIQEIKDAQVQIPAPVIKVQDARLRDVQAEAGGNSRTGIRVAFKPEAVKGVSPVVSDLIQKKTIQMLSAPGVEFVEWSASQTDIDGVLTLEGSVSSGAGKISLRLTDPSAATEFGILDLELKAEEPKASQAHQIDVMIRGQGQAVFLAAKNAPIITLSGADSARLKDFVVSCRMGAVNVMSSTPGASVFAMRSGVIVNLGVTPIQNKRLDKGIWRITVQRRGYAPFQREIALHPGETKDVFAAWADDPTLDALIIHSAPAGLSVSMDGTQKGDTPSFITGIAGGAHGVEVSASSDKTVLSDTQISPEEAGGGLAFLFYYDEPFDQAVMERDYWQLTSEAGGVEVIPLKGLGLRAKGEARGWQGLVSRNLPLRNMKAELDVVQSAGGVTAFGIVSGREAVLVQSSGGVFAVARFKDGSPVGKPRAFTALKEGTDHVVSVEYDEDFKMLKFRVDGDVVFHEEFKPAALARLTILSQAPSTDGRTLARAFRMRSGPRSFQKKAASEAKK